MPAKLTTTVNNIQTVPNSINAEITNEFYHYMKSCDVSENHQNNCLKVVIAFANFLGADTTFYGIKNREQVMAFLDTKVKNHEKDPDKKWITTWNHYLNRIRLFFRWLHNARSKMLAVKKLLRLNGKPQHLLKLKERKLNDSVHIQKQSCGIGMRFFLSSSMNFIFVTRLP